MAGQPFETLILAKEEGRKFHFEPLAPDQARAHLDAILSGWMQASTRALPLHCEAGFAWISSFYQSRKYLGDHDRAIAEAMQSYELALERDTGYLRGAYDSAEALLASGEFEALLHALYLPLWEAEQGKSATEVMEQLA